MKKLNKILAAISTAALTFCVWGTQTQAKVVTNENGVPTHIEADNKEEFFGDLKLVLNHIESRLVVEGKEANQIDQLFLKENGLTDETINTDINYSTYAGLQYKYALGSGQLHIGIATGYLYNLLLKSTISTHLMSNVYRLNVELNSSITAEIVFQLPREENVYYTPCLRWFLWSGWMRIKKLKPTPMPVRESFEKGPEFADPNSCIYLYVKDPDSTPDKIITTYSYHKTELKGHIDTIIPKLISIAGINIEDEELGEAFRSHSNPITDYYEFVKKYNK